MFFELLAMLKKSAYIGSYESADKSTNKSTQDKPQASFQRGSVLSAFMIAFCLGFTGLQARANDSNTESITELVAFGQYLKVFEQPASRASIFFQLRVDLTAPVYREQLTPLKSLFAEIKLLQENIVTVLKAHRADEGTAALWDEFKQVLSSTDHSLEWFMKQFPKQKGKVIPYCKKIKKVLEKGRNTFSV